MSDLVHGAGALEQVRAVAAAEARRLRTLADPPASAPASVSASTPASFVGGLEAGGLEGALERLRATVRTDLGAAADRLVGLERALHATDRSTREGDRRAATSLTGDR